MTKKEFVSMLVAAGVGFTGGATFKFSPGTGSAPPSTTFIHALRIEAAVVGDGGLGPDAITAYQTFSTAEPDGGVDLTDIGPASCTGDTRALRTWAKSRCTLSDGGEITGIYVLEVHPTGVESTDGGADVAVVAYGSTGSALCAPRKSAVLTNFLESINCTNTKRRSRANPL